MSKYKHLTLDERFIIEKSLDQSLSFKAIGREIGRDCTTISKEIKSHILHKKSGAFGRHFNNCINRNNCSQSFLCDDIHCNRNHCNSCPKAFALCPDYIIEDCQKLKKPPYVCNGCIIRPKCTLEKALYHAAAAHKSYLTLLSESRIGIATSEDEIERLNSLISPLLQRGQSIHHLCSHNKDAIMLSEKTIYNYVDYNLFSARNIDLPRKVTYKPRKNNKSHLKIDKSCRINRSYQNFQHFLSLNPDTSIVEMDTVIGNKGGKVLLTIHFLNSLFMLAFLRDANTSSSVIDIFNDLYMTLSPQIFEVLFPVILTDNGSEFSNPSAIEFDSQNNRRTYVFYCDPSAPYQKGANENNHEFIRRIIPKGHTFDLYTQSDINLMMSHINSYRRKKLNDKSPFSAFSFLYGNDIVNKLGINFITPNEVILNASLFNK